MIYLDYQATTPLAPEVAAAMRPWIETNFGNPHSSHRPGREAAAAIEAAREQVLSALFTPLPARREGPGVGESPETHRSSLTDPPLTPPFTKGGGQEGKLYFTSGATEAANWALKGAAADLPEGKTKIVTIATEHACVIDTAHWLAAEGREIGLLQARPDGLVDLHQAAEMIDETTGLVAAMLVNNEIGVIQPIEALSRLARQQDALFFCDAVQGFGREPIPLAACDMVAVSAHKVHGPKGIGALWIRDGVQIEPLLHGGGQEGGLRSGTLSPALCVGFGEAARLLMERRDEDAAHVEQLWQHATGAMQGWILNGSAERRYHGNLNIRADGIDAARLISDVREVAFSAGSACASGSGRPSHVLAALGLSDREARSSIRLGFGRYTDDEELQAALGLIMEAAARQRSFAA